MATEPDDVLKFDEANESDLHPLLRGVIHVVLIIASLLAIAPFIWALLTSLKPVANIFESFVNPIPTEPTLKHYVAVLTDTMFPRWVLNSLLITTGAVFTSLLFDSLAGFALAKGKFRGRYTLFLVVLGTLVIPPQAIMVPLYLEMAWMNMLNTYWAMMVIVISAPFGVFMMRQFYLSIPDSLLDAARIDGCNTFQIYTRIMLPIGKPALSSLFIFKFIFAWGAFLWPLIVANETAMFPLQVGLGLFSGQYGESQWGQILAVSILAMLPVLIAYLFAQRSFMEGIALSGSKG